MATSTVIEFAQRLETDVDLRRRVEDVKAANKDAALAAVARIAAEAGFGFSPADLEVGFTQLASGELGAADLDAVVGGAGALHIPTSTAFVSSLVKVVPGALPNGGFIVPCV